MTLEKPWETGALRVSSGGRSFRCGDRPFFWLADTAWLLFHQLTTEESYRYLRNRRELGYNVILADFIHTAGQTNLAGQRALIDSDPARPDAESGFWQHADEVIRMAEELGLWMGLLPVWGSSLVGGGVLNEGNLDPYLDFLLARYRDAPNIVWIAGGDVRGDANPALFRRMGRRLKADRPDRLVGYHPFGRTDSSWWFHGEDWLDFNLFQSGHRRYDQTQLSVWDDAAPGEGCFGEDNWRYVESDRARVPAKPTLDGEPSYEQIPQGLHDPSEPYWNSADVRRYAYWSVFAGAAGHTYGHNAVMQFYRDRSSPGAFGVRELWSDAVHHPGAAQMIHLKRLMESVGFENGRPAQELLCGDAGERYDRVSVFAGDSFILAYTFTGREIALDLSPYAGQGLSAYWMDPVTGLRSYLRAVPGKKEERFAPPSREDGSDTVLVIV